MVSLQHIALNAFIDTGAKYDGMNTVIENAIFEIEQLRHKVSIEIGDLQEEYKILKKIKDAEVYSNRSQKFYNIIDDISTELFDDFLYSESIETDGQVEWKEYFHCLYDAVVPDDREPYDKLIWTIVPSPPKELDTNDKMYPLVTSIKRKFEALRKEGDTLKSQKEILENQMRHGKELLKLKIELREKIKLYSMYEKIIHWSMH
jgi:hypothetical protein